MRVPALTRRLLPNPHPAPSSTHSPSSACLPHPAAMSASDTRRRAEIEAKRAKLAELKRAREERSSRIATGRAAGSGLVSEVRRPALRCRRDGR